MTEEANKVVKKRKLDEDTLPDTDAPKDETFVCDVDTVNEGLSHIKLTFNKALACRASPFFDKAFRDGSTEATTGIFKFYDDKINIWREVSSYIHRGRVFEDSGQYFKVWKDWELLCQLWLLAERLGISNLQNLTMDAIAVKANGTKLENFRTSSGLWYSYAYTDPGSPLRCMFRDIAVRKMQASYFERNQDREIFKGELLADLRDPLMARLKQKKKQPRLDAEQYYVTATPPGSHTATTSPQPEASKKRKLE
ncbi:hypothetical protein H2201_002321 [Coniosporium apollinis]|uniref:BTB domain-containing protein n=1 Tax=Coniosporium apollinis TaxID=61459 RepID=A0ABQ9NZN7_9PEZI|nr:hypothetical protein H2201_002321 [Coniosporium apollinis]